MHEAITQTKSEVHTYHYGDLYYRLPMFFESSNHTFMYHPFHITFTVCTQVVSLVFDNVLNYLYFDEIVQVK